jgi:penicillin-binding protein 1C
MIRRFLKYIFIKHRWKTLGLITLMLVGYIFCLPSPLFQDPYSLVLLDRNGKFLSAKISEDGQWRFPPMDSVPQKFIECITSYEDRRFYQHWGIDYRGIGRAIRDNWQAGKVKSGGSTITMQVMRLSHKRYGRRWFSKLLETIQASRLEWSYSKDEIMALYASHAPFGGNVVGLEAASWRYFGKSPFLLSWAEAATLAVLPNSPGLIHPGRNRKQLKVKRDRLLRSMLERQKLDSLTVELALQEPLPEEPLPLPSLSPHLLERAKSELQTEQKLAKLKTTIDHRIQLQANALLQRYYREYSKSGIHNLSAVIAAVETGEILAYVGNIEDEDLSDQHGDKVDIIQAQRSSGSILKPFLYALMLEEGKISPKSLLPDIPTSIHGYRPKNYYAQYDGVVQAGRALERSLNVPLVRMLQDYGVNQFHSRLRQMGFKTIDKAAKHYGLSLILGGAEVSLEDLVAVYGSMARTLNHYQSNGDCNYVDPQFHPLSYMKGEKQKKGCEERKPLLSAAAIYHCFENMRQLQRPRSEGAWEYFQSARQMAWKTGTSFGFRDAWAVGVTNKYVIGVWVGNADGEGRPELIGVEAAAPVLFELLDLLPTDGEQWFEAPWREMKPQMLCRQSGYLAGPDCPEKDSMSLPPLAAQLPLCPYHKKLHLDASAQYQVHDACEAPSSMLHRSYFVLPPLEESFYKLKDPTYEVAPPFREDCRASLPADYQPMEFVYPKNKTKIFLPFDYDGKRSKTVFKVTHRYKNAVIHWHLDQAYIGSTLEFHQMELQPEIGAHQILLVDQEGRRLEQEFEILRARE